MTIFDKVDLTDFSETERAIYRYLKSNPDQVAFMRVRELATAAHASASSVMRLIHKLGYESMSEFRIDLKSASENAPNLTTESQSLFAKSFPADTEAKIQQLAARIIHCENLIFFGIGGSGSMCEYAARLFSNLGCNSSPLTDYTYPLFSKYQNSTNNILITLSISGMTPEVLELVNYSRDRPDFLTVAVTSNPQSTLAKMSAVILDYHNMRRAPNISSQLPAIYLVEALAEAVAQLQKEK